MAITRIHCKYVLVALISLVAAGLLMMIITPQNPLDGCYHVYLDCGSNIGVQIRKLFEPEKYPNATVLQIFDKNFGSINERQHEYSENGGIVCAIGFEPNPRHTEYLKQIESSYNQCGWRVLFLTETAVSDHNGIGKFYTKGKGYLELGAGILPPVKGRPHKKVDFIRLSDFLKNVVNTRKLPIPPADSSPPRVVMKLDIEGSEVDVIADLTFNGGFQYINSIMVEWHKLQQTSPERKRANDLLKDIVNSLSEYSSTINNLYKTYDFNLINMDDESYNNANIDLPKC